MLKKKYVVTVLSLAIISVLVGSLFYYNMVQAKEVWDYDPWCDINDDGKINMKDIATVARKFMTSGDPAKNVTVTTFPMEFKVHIVPHTLNVTFANKRNISEGSHTYMQDVSGYERVCVGMNCTDGDVEIAIYHVVGGVDRKYDQYTIGDGQSHSIAYTVMFETIKIRVSSPTGFGTYSLGLYATD